jgi:RHS repeat-associated protein
MGETANNQIAAAMLWHDTGGRARADIPTDSNRTADVTPDKVGNLSRIPSTTPAAGLNWQTLTVDEWDTLTADEWDTLGVDPFEIGQTFTYDAWNRLVSVSDDGDLIQTNHYDGRNFRVVRETTAEASTGAQTRHCYFSAGWQSLEERLGGSSDPERQYVWGQRYIDDCVLRDRDTDANGTLDERLYPTQDANWNVTALVDTSGAVQERYAFSAYGVPVFLDASYGSRASSSYDWETLFDGYRYDPALQMFHVRYRTYNPELGIWLQRDRAGYIDGVNLYHTLRSSPIDNTDPLGLSGQKGTTPRTVGPFKPFTFPPRAETPSDIEQVSTSKECHIVYKDWDCPPSGRCETWKDIPTLSEVCENMKGGCGRLTLVGHGIWDGCGVHHKDIIPGGNKVTFVGTEVLKGKLKKFNMSMFLKCAAKTAKGGYMRVCSCNSGDAGNSDIAAQELADWAKIKICYCLGCALPYIDSKPDRSPSGCTCKGEWRCVDPI